MATLKQLVTGIVITSNKLSENLGELDPVTAACILQDAENLYDLLMQVTDYDDFDGPVTDTLPAAADYHPGHGQSGADEEESE